MVAVFMVPLFLSVIQSSVIEDRFNVDDSFILAGISLLAALASRNFIATLSEKVLQLAKDAQEKSNRALDTADQVMDELTEEDVPNEGENEPVKPEMEGPLAPDDELVLKTISLKPNVRRSV